MNLKYSLGFHLMELLVTLAIISIVTSLSVPLYSQYMVQTRRLEAAKTLSALAVAMEKYYIEHNNYQDATLAGLHFSEWIAKNNYHLSISMVTPHDYALIARPVGKQAEKDESCSALILNANGEKGISGSGKVGDCW